MFEEAGIMMVPSSFLVRDPTAEKPRTRRPPSTRKTSYSKPPLDTTKSPSPSPRNTLASPMTIPSPKKNNRDALLRIKDQDTRHQSSNSPDSMRNSALHRSISIVSVDALLAETAIPTRRKAKGRRAQRLPAGDHVMDFSRLLNEDILSREEGSLSGSFGNPQFELLFGGSGDNLEDAMFVGSESTPPHRLSVRSLSTESMPSIVIDEDSPSTSYSGLTTPSASPSPLATRRSSYRKPRVLSASEECAEDHPLFSAWEDSPKTQVASDLGRWSPESRSNSISKPTPTKTRSSFRSNLTASLRALKSAASTVSSFAASNPANRPDDFLTRSIFTFNPELTDDKRPPPSSEPPSPALRRYLNPDLGTSEHQQLPGSEFYTFHDQPTANTPSARPDLPHSRPRFPASIQLQTYLPPTTRSATGSASSPPRFGSPTPVNKRSSKQTPDTDDEVETSGDLVYNAKSSFHASPTLVRQREPRENPDFLRILVCEMQMRRKGKFGDMVEGRATFWLPPRKATVSPTCGKERWTELSSEEA